MLRPVDSDTGSEFDSWDPDEYYDYYDDLPPYDDDEDYFVWKRPNTYYLVPKFRELIAEHPEGILYKNLQKVFYGRFLEELDWTNFGYKTLDELLEVYPDIITCIKKGRSRDKWLIVDANRPHPDKPESPTDEYPFPEPNQSYPPSEPTSDWSIPIRDESDFTPKPGAYSPNSRSDERNRTQKRGAHLPVLKQNISNPPSESTSDWSIPKSDKRNRTPKPGAHLPDPKENTSNSPSESTSDWSIPKSDKRNRTPKRGAHLPLPKQNTSNPPSESTSDWSIPKSDERNRTPKPDAHLPDPKQNISNSPSESTSDWSIPKSDERDPTPKPGAHLTVPKQDTSNPPSESTEDWSIPKSDERDPTPKPGAHLPVPKQDTSNPTSGPTEEEELNWPIPIPDESDFIPKPGVYRPNPKRNEFKITPKSGAYGPISEPDESKSTPRVDSPKASPRLNPQLIDAIIEEISARLCSSSNFWNSTMLKPTSTPPLLGNCIGTENTENKCPHPKKHQKGKCTIQSPNDAAGTSSTEYSSPFPATTLNRQNLTLNLCRVCFSKPENGAFIHDRVGHIHGCYTCAKNIWYNNRECPVCSEKVLTVAELFF